MSQRFLLMEIWLALVTWWETGSLISVTEDSSFLEMPSGHVRLVDSGQGLCQSVIVCSLLQCNTWTDYKG